MASARRVRLAPPLGPLAHPTPRPPAPCRVPARVATPRRVSPHRRWTRRPQWPLPALRSASEARTAPLVSSGLLQRQNPEDSQHVLLVHRGHRARANLAQEVLLEGDLGEMDPFARLRPGDVTRRDFGQGDEGDTRIAEVGETYRIPCGSTRRWLASDFGNVVLADRTHHGFDHVAGLGRSRRHRSRLHGRYRDTNTRRIDIWILLRALMLIDQHEPARVAQLRHISDSVH